MLAYAYYDITWIMIEPVKYDIILKKAYKSSEGDFFMSMNVVSRRYRHEANYGRLWFGDNPDCGVNVRENAYETMIMNTDACKEVEIVDGMMDVTYDDENPLQRSVTHHRVRLYEVDSVYKYKIPIQRGYIEAYNDVSWESATTSEDGTFLYSIANRSGNDLITTMIDAKNSHGDKLNCEKEVDNGVTKYKCDFDLMATNTFLYISAIH
jgi:hypothetical protein